MLPLFSRPGDAPTEMICSAKGCRAEATDAVIWNNPKVHTPERRKVWLACPDHSDWLTDFLKLRSFWIETVAVTALGPADG